MFCRKRAYECIGLNEALNQNNLFITIFLIFFIIIPHLLCLYFYYLAQYFSESILFFKKIIYYAGEHCCTLKNTGINITVVLYNSTSFMNYYSYFNAQTVPFWSKKTN